MRILHVLSTLNPAYGGPVEAVKQLGLYVANLGVQIEVAVCGDRQTDPWISQYPLPVHALGPAIGKKYCYTPRLRPWLEKHGRSYDAWVINAIWQFNSIGTASVAQRMRMPYFVYTHGMLDPWSKRAHPIKHLKKLVYWKLFEQNVLERACAVCFTAEEESRLASTYFPSSSWNAYVVGSGIAPPPAPNAHAIEALLQRCPEFRGKRLWIFLGRIHPKKGVDLMLKAFSALEPKKRNTHLIVAGPGDNAYISAMQRLAADAGVAGEVNFTGPLYGESKWAALKISELFILPSHQENFGISVVEALAMGVPVCISDKVNIWREIAAAEAGIVCGDTEPSLLAKLQGWNNLDSAEHAAFSKRAVACFQQNFHVERAARRYIARLSQETPQLRFRTA